MSRLLYICLLLICHVAAAAPIGETRAFTTAVEIFRDKKYDLAERSFDAFLNKHPNSDFRAESVLYLGKSKVHLNDNTAAIELLEKKLPEAGSFADQYRYWIAEGYFRTEKFEIAAEKYADVVKNHLDSPLVLESAYNKSLCFSKLGRWNEVIELLGPERSFRKLTESKPNDRFAIFGMLLLSEALFMEKKFSEAEQQLKLLEGRTLDPDAQWRQQFLMARTQLALGSLPLAIVTSSNAVALARVLGLQIQTVDTTQVQAEIFEKAGQLSEAAAVYEQNIAAGLPQEHRRHALFKTIQLTIAQNKISEAITKLEQFVNQNTNDSTLDLANFTLGELRLKQVFALSEAPRTNGTQTVFTNLAQSALSSFNQVISNHPGSEFVGKAYLDRGWCLWIEGKYLDAQTSFAEATAKLPLSEEQGIARFKLADTQFLNGDFAGAISNYNKLLQEYAEFPAVKGTLFDNALYQIVRAGLHNGDMAACSNAMGKILEWYPNTGYADRSVLLVGQGLNASGSPAEARKLFSDFLKRWPAATLAPEVQLALAQTHMREAQWAEAMGSLENWTATYTNSTLGPQAEFSKALVSFQAGMETNALGLFTNFIAKYPTNILAAFAQNWIGDFYYNRDEFALAELNYQLVSKLNPSQETACQAKISAARAAFHRDDFQQAHAHFLSIINDNGVPTQFVAEAYFGLGDTIFSQFMTNTQFPAEEFRQAVSAYIKVTNPTNALSALAWGRLGECHLQWANQYKEKSAYDLATNAFQQVIDSPTADLKGKSLARLGMGKVMEAIGQPLAAKEHYAKVIYVPQGEQFDARCLKEAALASAKIYEAEGNWEQAMSDYERLMQLVPASRPAVEKKILVIKQMQNR